MRAETIKGHLDVLLLAVVGDRTVHGYAVITELAALSGGALKLPEGTVYPALHRLEAAGLLESEWSTNGGRRRRVYCLTAPGHAALDQRRADWRDFAAAVGAVLAEAPGPAATPAPKPA
jgi:DNA-binding PadR family transcriptional regulator